MARKGGDALRKKNASPKHAKSAKNSASRKGQSADQPRAKSITLRAKDQKPPANGYENKSTSSSKDRLEYLTTALAFVAAIAAIAAAGFTGYQAMIAEDTAIRQLRAYVGLTGSIDVICTECGDQETPPLAAHPNVVGIEVSNVGETPAHQLVGTINWLIKRPGERVSSDYPFRDFRKGQPGISSTSLQANRATILYAPIKAKPIQMARAGKADIYFYGHVDYIDIYGAARRTFFCWLYLSIPPSGGREETVFCPSHNHAN